MYKFVRPSTDRWTRNVWTADYVMQGGPKVHHQQRNYSRAGNGKNSLLMCTIVNGRNYSRAGNGKNSLLMCTIVNGEE